MTAVRLTAGFWIKSIRCGDGHDKAATRCSDTNW